jgi:hypothetical protein
MRDLELGQMFWNNKITTNLYRIGVSRESIGQVLFKSSEITDEEAQFTFKVRWSKAGTNQQTITHSRRRERVICHLRTGIFINNGKYCDMTAGNSEAP